MLIVLSPAKNLDYETQPGSKLHTQPEFLEQSQRLIDELVKLAPQDVSALMGISDKLGTLNYDRFQAWQTPFAPDNAKQAVLAFNGDVYSGLAAERFNAGDFRYAQKHLRILSGLYGLLRPMDLMQAYRLEMGTRFANIEGKDLYAFWGEQITDALNKQLKAVKSTSLVNLASNEYFKAVKPKLLNAELITPVFRDLKGDQYKVISFYAKKARGLMAAWIIQNKVERPADLKKFKSEGYEYNRALSTNKQLVFTRDSAAK